MSIQQPILSAPNDSPILEVGGSQIVHRISSKQTGGVFSVVEFISQPGEGVGVHIHENEEELVYLLEGQIEVTLGDQTIPVPQGTNALLPRGIPHGYVNTGDVASRLLAVLLPGNLDGFFVALDKELAGDEPHEASIERLCEQYGLKFLEESNK